jgi:hypothetical protein
MEHILRFVSYIFAIFSLSYFIGVYWYIFCDLWMYGFHDDASLDPDQNYFIILYDLPNKSLTEAAISVQYYAFTTLSTVGLGDLHPKNNFERIICSILMLVGVTTSSLLVQSF